MNTVTHSYDTLAVFPEILLVKEGQNSEPCLQVCTICNKNQQDAHSDQTQRLDAYVDSR